MLLSLLSFHPQVKKMNLKQYVIELSKRYSIVTSLTSFVAIEKREKVNVVYFYESDKICSKLKQVKEDAMSQFSVQFHLGWLFAKIDSSLEIVTLHNWLKELFIYFLAIEYYPTRYV